MTNGTLGPCYGLDLEPNTDSPLCQPDALVSNCCHATDICYSGGFCHIGPGKSTNDGVWFVGHCTDPSFPSPACQVEAECHKRNVTNPNSIGLIQCTDNTFCCYGDTGCDCHREEEVFTVARPTMITSLPPARSTSSAAPLTTSAPATSTSPDQKSSDLSSGAKIGVGVGVSIVGALVLAAVVLLVMRVMHRRRASKVSQELDGQGTDGVPKQEQRSAHIQEQRPAPISELSSGSSYSEIDGEKGIYEVEAIPATPRSPHL